MHYPFPGFASFYASVFHLLIVVFDAFSEEGCCLYGCVVLDKGFDIIDSHLLLEDMRVEDFQGDPVDLLGGVMIVT